MNIFKKLLLLSFCCIGAGSHLLAQEQISFTWAAGTVPKTFLLRATAGKIFTVNWGDSNSSTETGLGGSVNTLTHSYMSTGNYTVVITGDPDCLYTYLEVKNAQVIVLDVSNAPSLTDILCYNNALTNLNLNANGALKLLHCYNNALTNLDVTNNSNLEFLDCRNNQLTTLDVTQNTELLQLSCDQNQLTTLDVSQNLKLAYLLCYSNNLSILDISNNVQLNYLMCSDNQLSTLDITANPSLTTIYCDNNKLSLSHLYAISSLKPYQYLGKQYLDVVQAYENVEVDLTDAPTIGGTPTVFAVTKGGLPAPAGDYTINTVTGKIAFHTMGTYTVKKTNTAIKSHTTHPAEVYRTYVVAGTQSIIFTWKGATGKSFAIRAPAGKPFTVDWGDAGALSSYTGSGATDVTPTHTYATTNDYTVTVNGGDSTCRFTLLNLNNRQVSSLSVIEGTDLTELHCRNNTLSALNLTYNTALEYLDCHTNLLTTFNVSHNTALKHIDCSNNPLYSIDVSANTQLTNLQCTNNSLSSLDLSANILLATLNCSANALTVLDVSQNIQLTSLESNDNQLSSLDISNNTSLKSLNCAYNRLPELDITANPLQHVFCHSNSIPLGNLYDIATAIGNQNETQLGMQQLDTVNLSKGIGVTVDAVLNGVNTNFTVTMAGVGPVSDGVEYTVNYVTQKLTFNVPGTYTVKMTNAAIVDNPTPVQASVYRTYDVADSQTITFDWTGGPAKSFTINATSGQTFTVDWGDATVDTMTGAGSTDIMSTHTYANNNPYTVTVVTGSACSLTLLDVSNQQVTAINITDAPALTWLECQNNQLTTLNVSQNPWLNMLNCDQNPLTGLDVTANLALTTLHCSQTGLTALDVTLNSQLTDLHCSSNALTTLDVSLNTRLRTLNCKANLLTGLTLANNTQLIWFYCDDNRLTVLNINTNTALEVLTCENNNLIALNIDYNLQLTTLYCSGNSLTALNTANNVLLVVLHCDNNVIPALNITNNSVLSVLHCHNNAIPLANLYTLSNAISNTNTKWLGTQRLDTVTISTGVATPVDAVLGSVNTVFTVNNGTAVEGVDYTINYTTQTIMFNFPGMYTVKMTNTAIISNTSYPAEVWRTYNVIGLSSITFVWQGGTGKSFKITAPVGEQFTVDWGDGNVDTLTGNGLGMASALTPTHNYANTSNNTVTVTANSSTCQFAYLSLAGKQVLSLNVTNNIGLSQLDCSMNPALGTLDVTRNVDLAILDCIATSLTSLNLTNNLKLVRLNCSKNALTALDVSNNPQLYYLNCEENTTLLTLNVSTNMQLRELSCGNTSLTTLNVTANSQLQKLDCKDNFLTALDLSGNAQLTTVNVNNNHLPALNITGNPAVTNVACHNNHIPLANLYALSNAVTMQNNKNLGTQRLDTITVVQGVANSVDAVLGGVNTVFAVNGGAATDGVEYTVNYATQTITFNANGVFTVKMTNTAIISNTSYPSEVWRTYRVGSYDIAHATIAPIPSQTYTGYAIQPLPVVAMGINTLVKDTDYTVSYSGNIDVGSATVTITGTGSYYGTNQIVFTIAPMTVTVAELSVQTKVYDGTTGAVLLFDMAAFKSKLSPADTTTIIINAPTTGTFAQANEGINIPVTAAGNVTLSGAKAGNYIIIQQTGLTGTIVNNNTDATITVTNATYSPVDDIYLIECEKTTAIVQVNTVNPAALLIYNGAVIPGKQFNTDASTPGSWTETFTVSTPDSSIQQTYTITLVKWFDIDLTDDACIIKEKWNNTLLVNNNPASNGNYRFTTYAWFKNNILIGNDQSYSAGNASTDRLDPNAYYYVMMDTRDGQSLRTCPFHPLMMPLSAPAPQLAISVYPNPAPAGQIVQVTTNIPSDQLTNATIDVYGITGRHMSSQRMSSAVTFVNMPTETGIYILKVRTATTETTTTIIVN
ncbi:MAG: YDG domain-containing protein [Prevotellaceae bacterium]|jgi:Leucine-rich repeat (LRR) protein|nr:YDG domain-containing protein [Prevotellaceae bacterium]